MHNVTLYIAAYHIGLCKNTHMNVPKYSFGLKAGGRRVNTNPAPNNYTLPNHIGERNVSKVTYPAYTMGARQHIGGLHWNLGKVRRFEFNSLQL